ncbi:NAD(P)-binding protein [Nocardioides sp. CER19]|uniref:NAD(P)-binding protein n=1 Tax=Nocardioides sp. CER19 TaxID=3038538 RepID=UPI002446B466|nr:NAD(P)-binding protein [Nocardioides sp. CER19]MDH2415424.1 NAD(P)-binding protein [Nocardioides sp. CER19]
MAISAAGLAVAAAAPDLIGAEAALAAEPPRGGGAGRPSTVYPPAATGITGQTDPVVSHVVRIDGMPNPRDPHSSAGGPGIHPGRVRDTGEEYDAIIVGAGASGLAAAKYYRDRFGEDTRVLLVDPLADFGGHGHRNEFDIPDATTPGRRVRMLRTGGAVNLDSIGSWNQPANGLLDIPGSYGQPALDMLDYLGITPDAFPSSRGPGIPSSYGLRSMLLFPKKEWKRDHLVPAKTAAVSWEDFLASTPYSARARADLLHILADTTTDWISRKDGPKTDQEKKAILASITYKEYLRHYVGAGEEAISYLQRSSHGLFGAGVQAVQAADTWALGNPGFDGLGLTNDIFPGIGRTAQQDSYENSDPTIAWPDGNSSVLRLLVSRLIPNAICDVDGARPDQETIVKAVVAYDQLDRRTNHVRIRLNSTVVRVEPGRTRGGKATVTYVRRDGVGERVRARHVVMACWNRVTARLVDGLPRHQVENLTYARKVPLVYCRVALRNWQAFADAKISSISPRGDSLFWDSCSLQAGQVFGSAYGPTPTTPDRPALLSLNKVPNDPRELTQLASYERGRQQLLTTSLRTFEHEIVDLIDRTVNASGGDFEPERDIESIVVNRWNYGYAYELCSTFDPSIFGPAAQQPHVKGRVPYRNVSIANSDSGAFAYTHSAINEAFRAVNDLPA